jgi:quinol monooxygenase YgiN
LPLSASGNLDSKTAKRSKRSRDTAEIGYASRQEAGVITYTTHVDPDNPREFFIYEKYHDVGGLEFHQETTHF